MRKGRPLHQVKGLTETGLAEGLFNEGKWLSLRPTAPHYIHYVSPENHRYDEVKREAGWLVCRRQVTRFLTEARTILPIERLSAGALYLVFARQEWAHVPEERVELQRECLKLVFTE